MTQRLRDNAAVLVALALSVLLMATAIEALGPVPSIQQLTDSRIDPSQIDLGKKKINLDTAFVDNFLQDIESVPELDIHGKTKTNYLRTNVYGQYTSVVWSSLDEEYRDYRGERLRPVFKIDENAEFTVDLLKDIGGPVPAPLYTLKLDPFTDAKYSRESGLMREYGSGTSFTVTSAVPETQSLTDTSSVGDVYLSVPRDLASKLEPLASEVTEGLDTDYRKLKALESYLRSHYTYNLNYERPPIGTDAVEYFLFESGEGVCTHFNSAMVLMARSIGIPTRFVGGYFVDAFADEQIVFSIQRHAFTEAPFPEVGWAIFDATPASGFSQANITGSGSQFQDYDLPENETLTEEPPIPGRVPTVTEVTEQAASTIKGEGFHVMGRVTEPSGMPVTGLLCKAYISESKDVEGLFIGEANATGGVFDITCSIPPELDPGDYQILVHTIGDTVHEGSWSDPPIAVQARTMITAYMPNRVPVNRPFLLSGRLSEKYTDEPLPGTFTSVFAQGQILRLRTEEDGGFEAELSIPSPGATMVSVLYRGDGYYLEASKDIKVEALPITLTHESGDLVRGEPSTIQGRVHAEEIPCQSEPVTVDLPQSRHVTTTGIDGSFLLDVTLPGTQPLGSTGVAFTLERDHTTFHGTLQVKARTNITVAETPQGKDVEVTATLTDDHGAPLKGGALTLTVLTDGKARNQTAVTGQDGSAEFLLEAVKARNASATVTYTGSSVYTPAQASLTVPLTSTPWLIYLAAALAASGTGAFLIKGRPLRQAVAEVKKKQPEVYTGTPVTFPGIEPPLPPVLGVEEKITVHFTELAPGETHRLDIGESTHSLEADEAGEAETTISFTEKGDYPVKVYTPTGKLQGWAVIRVVDYGEEVVRLFNGFFMEHHGSLAPLNAKHTARELLSYIAHSPEQRVHLETVVSMFEEVNYSTHPVERQTYTRYYVSQTMFEDPEYE